MRIQVKNYQKFQHYKKRNPPWIRLYTNLLKDREWFSLSGDDAKTLVMLWIIASEDEPRSGNLPPLSDLAFRLRTSEADLEKSLSRLSHWIVIEKSEHENHASNMLATCYHDASNMLATCKQLATSETETETETEEGKNCTHEKSAETEAFGSPPQKNVVETTTQETSPTSADPSPAPTTPAPKKKPRKPSARYVPLEGHHAEDFWAWVKANPKYAHIDIARESEAMDKWLLEHPKKGRIKNRAFAVNWFDRIGPPLPPLPPDMRPAPTRGFPRPKTLAEVLEDRRIAEEKRDKEREIELPKIKLNPDYVKRLPEGIQKILAENMRTYSKKDDAEVAPEEKSSHIQSV